MKEGIFSPVGFPVLLVLIAALSGCTVPAFSPARYVVDPNRTYNLSTAKTVLVCPAFDRLDDYNRSHFDPNANPSAYLTEVIEQELSATNVQHSRVTFGFAPSFEGLQKALQGGALPTGGSVVLASAINHFPNDRVLSCDFELFSAQGKLLFGKRCLCMSFRSDNPKLLQFEQGANFIDPAGGPSVAPQNRLVAPRMVMQQLLADPDFQKAIQ